ncbi:MAG: alpha-amylase [Planctomycetota bacterium]|nr:MAG: alpha-amylase [Planctomycetota bacterium]
MANRVATEEGVPPSVEWPDVERLPNVPEWVVDAVFYQIFPERFRNGDPSNDPTHASLEFPDVIPMTWTITPWTSDFYARADWEQQSGDSFYKNGVFNRRYGGDLQGVIDKLDYLAELGVTALYFNPVFYGRSLHKYDGASMHHIDPYFGPDPAGDLKLMAEESSDPKSWHWTAADKQFLKLLEEAKRRGLRVVIDGVFNHTGRDFFAFDHLRDHQQQSPYGEWYIVQHYDNPATPANEFRYKGWWGIDTLPEFANNAAGDDLHEGPRQYVMDITARWMDPNGDGDPSDGIDGWRLDVAEEVPLNFWKAWNARVRELNPQAYTVAEIWNDARTYLVGGGFSATMNYHAFAYPAKGFLMDGRLSAHDFGRELLLRRQKYPPAMQFALQNLVDSHDTDRLASMLVNHPGAEPYRNADRFDYDESGLVSPRQDPSYAVRKPGAEERRLQRMVVLLQMTYLGAPMVYYGDEAGMWGGDDPCCRKPMVWSDLDYAPEAGDPLGRPRPADEVAVDEELLSFYRRAIELRRKHDVLRRGSCTTAANDDDAKFFAFQRALQGRRLLVAFNRGDEAYAWRLPADALSAESATPPMILFATGEGAQIRPAANGGQPTAFIPARTGVVLAGQSP